MKEKFKIEENIEYWEDPNTRSLIDHNLKQLEIEFICKYLNSDLEVIDLGCGDGETLVEVSKLVKSVRGIERSCLFLEKAIERVRELDLQNARVTFGDILESKIHQKFDIVITERVLINFPSWKQQCKALDNIYEILKPGGLYIMVENTNDGHDSLNALRGKVGLKPLAIHWNNVYFDFELLEKYTKDKFDLIERKGFSFYYLLTRVFTPMFAHFEGFGINAKFDGVYKMSDPAAKFMYDKIGDLIEIKENNNIIGSIQGFVFQKK